jgi:urate oxidase
MGIVLGENRYGKAENRVVRVTRNGDNHSILDLNVSIQISGNFSDTHHVGDNSKVLPTDTQKNTVYAFAQKYPAMEPEAFGLILALHFLDSQSQVTRAEIRIEQYTWSRILVEGKPHPRAFARDGSYVRVASVIVEPTPAGRQAFIVSGLEKLVVLKTSDSEFTGYLKDQYTTLQETSDRIMATEVAARWRHMSHEIAELERLDWATSFELAKNTLLACYGGHYSLSLQQTMYAMAEEVLKEQPGICSVRLSLPNKHHFLVDLSAFGQQNADEVYHADDRPYGLIEAVISRDDAPEVGPIWPSW